MAEETANGAVAENGKGVGTSPCWSASLQDGKHGP